VLPAFSEETIEDGARIEFTACGGGGYERHLSRRRQALYFGGASHR
jgi:N-methylhydantoinase B